jgi:hypothetical protein
MHEHIRLHKQSVKATEIFCGLLWALESLWQISREAAPVKDKHMPVVGWLKDWKLRETSRLSAWPLHILMSPARFQFLCASQLANQMAARTLKDLADERCHDLLAHDAQLSVPQRVLKHLRHRIVRLRSRNAAAARRAPAGARLGCECLLRGRRHLCTQHK